jgi:RNA polymerase sigma factor for flagellar operon FliA
MTLKVYTSVLDSEIDDDGNSFGDIIKDDCAEEPCDSVSKNDTIKIANYLSECLTKNEKFVLKKYYNEDMTFSDIGLIMKLSRARIHQIYHASIRKLKLEYKRSKYSKENYYGKEIS